MNRLITEIKLMLSNSTTVIVGAGPYGLSAAAHLNAKGVNIRVFGEAMSFWERHMPDGMLLRSPWEASHLSDPTRSLTLDGFQQARGERLSRPLPLKSFLAYGRWFQRQAVPNLEERKVREIGKDTDGFRVTLEDGEVVPCGRVIVAGGLHTFAVRLSQFAGMPQEFVSHASEQRDLSRFRGRRVVVIGGGQSGLECAALLHENEAEVELVVRDHKLHWTWKRPWLHTFKPLAMFLYAWPDVGPALVSHAVARPNLYRLLPRNVQDSWRLESTRPNGTRWLQPRLRDVALSTNCSVIWAKVRGSKLELKLSDGSHRMVDHIVMATGYRTDVSKYEFLDRSLVAALRTNDGFPVLGPGFESSVPGLHFLGAPAAWSYGPLMRFVAGADFAARAVTQSVIAARRPAILPFRHATPGTVPASSPTEQAG